VKAFRDASLKGWAYAFDHIEETARVIKQFYNGQDKSFESLVFEGQELKKLAYKNDLVLGHVSKDKINDIADLYFKMGMIEKKTKLTDFVFE
jgi:polar amino acid transport system substrate-binding protein